MKLQSPLLVTGVLVALGTAFAGFVISAMPEEDGQVPIVQAQAEPFKAQPGTPFDSEVDMAQSTIYGSMRNQPLPVVQDLSEPTQGQPYAVAQDITEPKAPVRLAAVDKAQDIKPLLPEMPEPVAAAAPEKKINIIKGSAKKAPVRKETKTVSSAPAKPDSPPDTLEFVRSVLDQKDSGVTASRPIAARPQVNSPQVTMASAARPVPQPEIDPSALNDITPAAGAAFGAARFYVQLGSVQNEAGAESEWSRLQKSFAGDLAGTGYRVQEADLGARGIYYRIQAGPMSHDQANSVCDSIKAQKPGGCLVVK